VRFLAKKEINFGWGEGIVLSIIVLGCIFYFGIYEPNKFNKLKDDVTESIKYTTASTINEHPDNIEVNLVLFDETKKIGDITYYKTIVDISWNGYTQGVLFDVEWETRLAPKGFGLIVSCDGCVAEAEAELTTPEAYGRWIQIDRYATKMGQHLMRSYSDKYDAPEKPETLVIDESESYYKQFNELFEEAEPVDTEPEPEAAEPVVEEPAAEESVVEEPATGPTPEDREKINDESFNPNEPFSDQREEIYGDMECPPPTYCDDYQVEE
jgi:hypothetical protein